MKGICLNFTLPTLKKYEKNGKKDWRIEYYFEGKRQQIKVNKWREGLKNDKEAEKFLNEYIIILIDQLKNGVNPFSSTPQKTDITIMNLVFDYIAHYKMNNKEAFDNDKYGKVGKRLQDYDYIQARIESFFSEHVENYLAKDITLSLAQDIINKMQVTYNWGIDRVKKYLSIFKNAYILGIDNKICTENPFAKVKISGKRGRRRAVTNNEWQLIEREIYDNDYNFYIFCKFVSHLIRPAELERIKKKNINLNDMAIMITDEISKTNIARTIYIQKSFYAEFNEYLKRIDFDNLSNESFLFGKKFKPSLTDHIADVAVSAHWRKICNNLELPKDCELYGLRHKTISDMANSGIPLNVIRLQAGHTQTIMTAHYANHYNQEAVEYLQNWG